jgi:hypothetical protein
MCDARANHEKDYAALLLVCEICAEGKVTYPCDTAKDGMRCQNCENGRVLGVTYAEASTANGVTSWTFPDLISSKSLGSSCTILKSMPWSSRKVEM